MYFPNHIGQQVKWNNQKVATQYNDKEELRGIIYSSYIVDVKEGFNYGNRIDNINQWSLAAHPRRILGTSLAHFTLLFFIYVSDISVIGLRIDEKVGNYCSTGRYK